MLLSRNDRSRADVLGVKPPSEEIVDMRKVLAEMDQETRSQLLLLADIAIAICASAAVVGFLQMTVGVFWN